MPVIRELVTKWGFDVNDKPLKDLDKNLSKIQRAVKVIGGIVIGAAGSMFGLAQSTAMVGDNIAKTADKLGIGIAALQELRFAADLAGVSTGNFDNAIRFLARNLGDAANNTGEAKEAFKELGISIKDDNGTLRKAEDVLMDISEAFRVLDDDTKKVTLAMDIFGRSGTDMINLLNQGKTAISVQRKEAQSLGIVLSEVAARDSEKFIDAQTRLKAAFTGVRNIIGVDLLPVIIGYTDSFRAFVVANREFIKSKIDIFLKGLIRTIRAIAPPFNTIVRIFSRLLDLLGGSEVAARRFLKVLGAIAVLQIVNVLGGITISLFGLAKAFKVAGTAAIAAQAKALIFPVLIGAAIVSLGLLVEDFFVFLKGGESVFENLSKKFGLNVDKIREDTRALVSFIKNDITDLFNTVTKLFSRMEKDAGALGTVIKGLFFRRKKDIEAFRTITKEAVEEGDIKSLGTIFDISGKEVSIKRLSDFFNINKTADQTPGTNTFIVDVSKIGGRALTDKAFVGPTFQKAPILSPNKAPQNFSINAPITVTVPNGTPVEQIVPKISAEIKNTFDDILRRTANSNKPAVVF